VGGIVESVAHYRGLTVTKLDFSVYFELHLGASHGDVDGTEVLNLNQIFYF
jgi:hypothetical protein